MLMLSLAVGADGNPAVADLEGGDGNEAFTLLLPEFLGSSVEFLLEFLGSRFFSVSWRPERRNAFAKPRWSVFAVWNCFLPSFLAESAPVECRGETPEDPGPVECRDEGLAAPVECRPPTSPGPPSNKLLMFLEKPFGTSKSVSGSLLNVDIESGCELKTSVCDSSKDDVTADA
jgi:hypothetical protein